MEPVLMTDEERTPAMPAPTSQRPLPHLRAWRVERDLTQRQLAEKARVALSTVTRAESGDSVAVLTAGRLARALGISVRQLQEEPPQE